MDCLRPSPDPKPGVTAGLSSVSDRTTNVAFLLARYGTEESANLRFLLERAFYPVSIAERNVDLVFPKFFRTFVNGMPVEEIKGRINRGKLVRSAVERNDDLFDHSVETFPERCHESCPNLWDGDSAIVGYPSIHSLLSLRGTRCFLFFHLMLRTRIFSEEKDSKPAETASFPSQVSMSRYTPYGRRVADDET